MMMGPNHVKPGWAYRKDGFYHNDIRTHCQIVVPGKGLFTHECGKNAPFARTYWNGSVGFCCLQHVDDMIEISHVVLEEIDNNGAREVVVMSPDYTGPFYMVVDGTVTPSEHPVHWDLMGFGLCWCGAELNEDGWAGGELPLDADLYLLKNIVYGDNP